MDQILQEHHGPLREFFMTAGKKLGPEGFTVKILLTPGDFSHHTDEWKHFLENSLPSREIYLNPRRPVGGRCSQSRTDPNVMVYQLSDEETARLGSKTFEMSMYLLQTLERTGLKVHRGEDIGLHNFPNDVTFVPETLETRPMLEQHAQSADVRQGGERRRRDQGRGGGSRFRFTYPRPERNT